MVRHWATGHTLSVVHIWTGKRPYLWEDQLWFHTTVLSNRTRWGSKNCLNMAISEGPGDETWLILDSLHSWTQWGLHRRVRVNIKQKWPSALEGLTPTTSRSPLVLKKHELSDSESPVTVHITSATSYHKHFLGVVLNAELVSVDTVGFVSFTTPPSSLSPRPKLGTLGEFIVLAQLEPNSILRMARKSSSLEQVNVFFRRR